MEAEPEAELSKLACPICYCPLVSSIDHQSARGLLAANCWAHVVPGHGYLCLNLYIMGFILFSRRTEFGKGTNDIMRQRMSVNYEHGGTN